jgi:hypothetical protein
MSHTKKKATATGRVKFKDLSAKKNPKGGSGLKLETGGPRFLNPQPLPP